MNITEIEPALFEKLYNNQKSILRQKYIVLVGGSYGFFSVHVGIVLKNVCFF